MNRTLVTFLVAISALSGCDYTGEFLFSGAIEGMDSIYHIYAEDGSDYLVPTTICDSDFEDRDCDGDGVADDCNKCAGLVDSIIESADEIPTLAIYAEIGPTGNTLKGGATFYFEGTGDDVCVWVDPETAFYSQVVDEKYTDPNLRQFAYPNNLYDDGDLDLFVGKSVFYTGSPGEVIGDFFVSYTDSLGNEVPIELTECSLIGWQGSDGGAVHMGRGQPEFCTINNTEIDISYTVLMHTFSTPLDDDRLGYALFLYNGTCAELRNMAGISHDGRDECLLFGDSIFPTQANAKGEIDFGPWYGHDADRSWPGSEAFEQTFCDAWGYATDMTDYCEDEIADKYENGAVCNWETITDPANRCYCGDVRQTPTGGAL